MYARKEKKVMHAVDTGRRLQFIEMGKGRGKGRTKRTKNLKTTVDHGTYIHDISTPQTQKTEEIQINSNSNSLFFMRVSS